MTAVTQVKVGESRCLKSRLLLDSGSQRSYITDRLAKKLYIKPNEEDFLLIYTFGSNKPKEVSSPSTEIIIVTKRGVERKIRVNIVPHITERVPVANFHSPDIDIVADDSSIGENIDLLIGNDLYFSFIKNKIINIGDHVYLVDSDFGWLITGSFVRNKKIGHMSVITYCQCHDTSCPYFTEPDLPLRSIDVKFLWALESIGITDSPKTTSEEESVQHFNETVEYSDGRYQVKWPWIQYPPVLPSNYGLAYGRLKGLLRRSNEDMLKEYNKILKEQLEAKIIEIVEPASYQQTTHPVHYLPHHMVQQPGKRGRIVYDASSKSKNEKSLNECLYRGPSMLEDLVGLILKFRMGRIGVTADVEKAFLQVGLQEPDRDVTRFLWAKDPTNALTEDNIIQYRFCRVPFGIISSPFLLAATIRYHISKTNKDLLSKIADRCYVDNLVTSTNTVDETLKLYEDTSKIFNELGMNIRDWMSNSNEFIDSIPEAQRAKQKDKMKILGLLWNIEEDTLQLKVEKNSSENEVTEKDITKKGVLRVLARLYDPCGFASPLVLPGKLLFQDLCKRKLKWDDTLPEDLLSSWKTILNSLLTVGDIKIARHIGSKFPGEDSEYELHGFTDASMNAYAAVVYLRVISKNNMTTSFLMSKSRVTPTEDKNHLKIPRLELLGYLIGSRLLKYIKGHLEVNISKSYLWTDSEIVLAWMKSSKLLPPFVSRRINEIKQTKDALNLELCYVNTKENPADIATRPDSWYEKQELWLHGPKFLKEEQKDWPKKRHSDEPNICLAGRALELMDIPEMSAEGYDEEMILAENQEVSATDENETLPDVSSSTTDSDVTLSEIKSLQKTYFPEEISGKETSLTRNLGLFLDEDGLLRCKGRLTNTSWSYSKKYPILIPKDAPFTVQTIQRIHEDNYHVGVSHTLSILRDKYWIPQGRAQVQKIVRKCPQCVKHGGGPYQLPPAPALPSERVNYSTPFTYTGLDYLGPILVATDKGKEKRWICLLTCLAVRALHLELVKDLTAEECLMALRRFTATRGIPKVIVSDNALQFKLTSEVLSGSYCDKNNIKWKFIAQLAPWQGGFYERLVALVKHCLKRTLGKHLLTDSQMHTIIKEVESVLNTRPLTTVGSEIEEVLRPADFLSLGKCLETHPSIDESVLQGTNTKVDLMKGWKRGQIILEEYKNMFMNQYLPSLRERCNQSRKQPRVRSTKQPKIGDIVQIRDDSKNRINWKVGKITSLIESRDGDCRVAKVMVGRSEFTRSLSHLYPLEADTSNEEIEPVPTGEHEHPSETSDILEPLSLHKLKIVETPTRPSEADKCKENPMQVEDEVSEQTVIPELVTPDVMPVSDSAEFDSIQTEQNVEVEERAEERASQDSRPMTSTEEVASVKRSAAIRAREKIAEWTQQLVTLI